MGCGQMWTLCGCWAMLGFVVEECAGRVVWFGDGERQLENASAQACPRGSD